MSELITNYKPNHLKVLDIETNKNLLEILPNKLTLDTYYDYNLFCYLIKNNFDNYCNQIIKTINLII